MSKYIKNFDCWNKEKQYVNSQERELYFAQREIWWCSLGVNVGTEIDGKNGKYERPVLILKHINKDMALILPLTSKAKADDFHLKISSNNMVSFVKISQSRTISSKRLIRKIDTLDDMQFLAVYQSFIDFLYQ